MNQKAVLVKGPVTVKMSGIKATVVTQQSNSPNELAVKWTENHPELTVTKDGDSVTIVPIGVMLPSSPKYSVELPVPSGPNFVGNNISMVFGRPTEVLPTIYIVVPEGSTVTILS